ncbi:complement component 1 Q subcomponent-binding protein, mitochondrial [Zootermopsis nevadensis]|uniref:Complement component 1 Q subcomponent-binding protein, mitochondrial n=1 Tax=Zootermopsis nevadensis TaxID=136037 RepID=A0A067R160_ZOONE|nr:complement component 1 Q subcomponent-binding protein, mitochondrial [Zootermopsis nevadensis]KDR12558.1 Complement component 1 Q subcomponent-binding protein, mitochondrial [Zootermopsis nevadensis]
MNGMMKAALRFSSFKSVANPLKQALLPGSTVAGTTKQHFARTLWHMCSTKSEDSKVSSLKFYNPTNLCSCGCGSQRLQHTKSEQELVQFLSEEIAAECKAQKIKSIPSKVDDFEVKLNGADVTLTKKTANETVIVNFNVNHTVDTDGDSEPELNPNMDRPDFAELKSKPTFDVDLQLGDQTLSFTCSFLPSDSVQQSDDYNDIFGIDEVTIFNGEWNDKAYAVAGDVLDGCLYDLLMNLLEERGISNEFVDKLSDFSTAYEHSLYIALLENTKKFVSGK